MQADKSEHPEQLSNLRTKAQVLVQKRAISRATSEREKKRLQTLYGVKKGDNPLLRLSVDLTQ